jgi:hypothetical protein
MTNHSDDKMLDDLFGQARATPAQPSDALMARIAADAVAVMPAPMAHAPKGMRVGFLAALAAALGGWPVISGLTAATVAGVWIGFSPPQSLDTIANDLWGGSDITVPFLELSDPFGLEG